MGDKLVGPSLWDVIEDDLPAEYLGALNSAVDMAGKPPLERQLLRTGNLFYVYGNRLVRETRRRSLAAAPGGCPPGNRGFSRASGRC